MKKDKKKKLEKQESAILKEVCKLIDSDIKGVGKVAKLYLEDTDSIFGGILSGGENLAVVCITVGVNRASRLMQELSETDIERLTLEIANMYTVLEETKESALLGFYNAYQAQAYIHSGGLDLAKEILSKAFGKEYADGVVSKLTINLQTRPFDCLRKLESDVVAEIVKDEKLEVKAVLCNYIRLSQAAKVFEGLKLDDKIRLTKIISAGGCIKDDIKEIEERIAKKVAKFLDVVGFGGIDSMAEILSATPIEVEVEVLEKLRESDLLLAAELENRIFIFEDILCLCNKDIQKIDKQVLDIQDWVIALKGCSDEVQKVILNNIEKERQMIIQLRLENSGFMLRKDVEKVQRKIITIIKHLRDTGEIIVPRSGVI